MSRKDYVSIAEVIKASAESDDPREYIARNVADVLEQDNPRFDRARFMVACGIAP